MRKYFRLSPENFTTLLRFTSVHVCEGFARVVRARVVRVRDKGWAERVGG